MWLLWLVLVLVLACPLAQAQVGPAPPGHIILDDVTVLRQRPRLRFPPGMCDDDVPNNATFCDPTGGTGAVGGNPTATVGLSAVNGSASTFLRSDGAPPLSQSISPTWTGTHTFNGPLIVPHSTTLPATCAVGQVYMDTDATSGQRWYLCESTNTWVAQGGGGGGGGTVTGSGTVNILAKWLTGGTSLGDSGLTDDGTVLQINRGYQQKVTTTSTDLTLTTAHYQVNVTTGASDKTLTLPAASGKTGQVYHVVKVDSGAGGVIIAPNGSDLLNGVNAATTANTQEGGGYDITYATSTGWQVTTIATITGGSGTITGSGTAGTIPLWTGASALGDSGLTDTGGVLAINRGTQYKVTTTSTDLTLTVAHAHILVTTGTGGVTITVPAASGKVGQVYVVQKVDSGAGLLTLAPTGSDTFNGVNVSMTVARRNEGFTVSYESSTGWQVGLALEVAPGMPVSTFTEGSVLFIGTGPALQENNANFFWDDTNKVVKIGAASGQLQTTISTAGQNYTETDGGDVEVNFRAAGGGTVAAPTATAGSQALGAFRFVGHDGTNWRSGSMIRAQVPSGGVSFGQTAAFLNLHTADYAGVMHTRLTVTPYGVVDIDSAPPLYEGVSATAAIGSGANGTVTVTYRPAGVVGNIQSVLVEDPGGPNIDPYAYAMTNQLHVALGTDGGSAFDPAKNTATLLAAVINDTVAGWSAVASGTGGSALTGTEGPTTLTGGIDPTSIGVVGQVEFVNGAVLAFSGPTSGLVKIKPADAAGTWTLTLPTDDGSSGQFLQTDGAGVTSWATGGGGGMSIGGTVTSGTAGSVLFVNSGPVLAQDNTNFVFDDTNNTLKLGNPTSPSSSARLSVGGNAEFQGFLSQAIALTNPNNLKAAYFGPTYTFTGINSTHKTYASYIDVLMDGTGDTGNVTGQFVAVTDLSTATQVNVIGFQTLLFAEHADFLYGYKAVTDSARNNATVYGFYAQTVATTVGNAYGFYAEAMTTGTAINYSFFGAGKSSFAGVDLTGHTVDKTSGAAISGTNCGTFVGGDVAGKFVSTNTGAYTCTVTFGAAYVTNKPSCVCNNQTTVANICSYDASSSTSAGVFKGTSVSGDVLNYICIGNQG